MKYYLELIQEAIVLLIIFFVILMAANTGWNWIWKLIGI